MKNIRFNLIIIFSLATYRIGLDLIYKFYLTDLFGYYGFYGENSLLHYIISWVIFFVSMIEISAIIEKKINLSNIVIVILYLVSFVPFLTMLAFNALSSRYYYFNTIYWIILLLSTKILNKVRFIKPAKVENGLSDIVIWIIGIIALSIVVLISWRYTGFRFTLDLLDVYSIRGEVISNLPTILQYIYLASNAINPILLIYSLVNRNYPLALFIVIVQLLSFGINGSKSVFFMTVLTLIVFVFIGKKVFHVMIKLLSSLTILSILELIILKASFLIDIIIRRVMFLPNLISYYYFDFFTKNSPDFFKQSILGIFGFESDYGRIPVIIGNLYFNNENTAANSGLISDAVQNIGLVGVFIMPFTLAAFLKILNDVSHNLNYKIIIITALYISNVLISSTLSTSLLTHGLLAIIVVLYFMPRNQSGIKK